MADPVGATLSVAIPVANSRDFIFDPSRGLLYITTADGNVERYDVDSRSLLTPFDVGNTLNGADITADGTALYVAEGTRNATQGFVRKVDLSDGSVTNIAYDLAFGEGGAWDIAIGSTGNAVVSTTYEGSGWSPLRELNLGTDELSLFSSNPGSSFNQVRGGSRIHRSADRDVFLITEADISSGPLFTYDAVTGTFPANGATGTFLGNISAVNRNGTLLAVQIGGAIAVMSAGLAAIETLDITAAGVAFDPTRDVLYATDALTDELVAFDTQTFGEIYRLDVGADIQAAPFYTFQSMLVSDDGGYGFVPAGSEVRMLQLAELGTAAPDTLAGSAASDFMIALGGNDHIAGNGGADTLWGSGGADVIWGNAGNDELDGGSGADSLYGGVGNDSILGGAGNDLLFGNAGADTLVGGGGDDRLMGGDANDTLSGSAGNDRLQGGSGWDSLDGGPGNDWMAGDLGNDTLNGSTGKDTLVGGDGDGFIGGPQADTIIIDSFAFRALDGGDGADKLVFAGGGFDVDLRLFDDESIKGIEIIDIRGSGANALTLSASDVLALSDTSDTLIVRGNADDALHLVGDWEVVELDYYSLYTLGAASVLASIATAVTVEL